jgi:uncharacterized membrane protein
MKLLLCLLLASGGVLIGLSIPLIQRKVPPNPWYGFRVRRMLKDREIWYPANAYSGWCMLRLGAAIMIAAVVAYFVPGLDDAWYASTVGIVAAIGLITSLVQCFLYLRKVTHEKH